MKRIKELQEQLHAELEKILSDHAFGFSEFHGTWRGDRKIRGPFVSIEIQGDPRLTPKEKRQIVALFNKYYGPIRPRTKIPSARLKIGCNQKHAVLINMDLIVPKQRKKSV